MINANNASLLRVSWQDWLNLIHAVFYVSLSPSLTLSVSLSPPLCLPRSLICPSPSPLAGRARGVPTETGYAVCQPAADVPGGDPLSVEVSNKESLGPGTAGQAVSLSAIQVRRSPTAPLVRLAVLSLSLYLNPPTPPSVSFFDGKSCRKNKKKPSNKVTQSTPNKLLEYFPATLPPP